MKLLSVAALLLAAASTVNTIMVNTPASAVECQPLLITWDGQGSAGPFFLSVVPGNSPSAAALFTWSNLTGTSFTWVVAEPAGTSLGLLLRDQTGATSQSAPFTVQNGTSSSCLNSTMSSSIPPTSSSLSSNSTSSSSTSTTSTTKLPTPTTTTSTRTPTSVTPSPPTSSASGNSTGNTAGGALNNVANLGSAGLLAVLIGAFLV